MTTKRFCKACKWYDGEYCVRFPPTILDATGVRNVYAEHPFVYGFGWCGEYRPRPRLKSKGIPCSKKQEDKANAKD